MQGISFLVGLEVRVISNYLWK